MRKGKACTTYQLTFIPRGKDTVVDHTEALKFAEQLRAEFGYSGTVEVSPLYKHQHVVYLSVKLENIRKIVVFMQKKGFGRVVAERWWLNAVQSFDPWRMVTGINIANIPVSKWINELPR